MSQATSLYLAPANPDSAPEIHAVRQVLADLEIIADSLGPGTYRAGDGFSRHVIFAGCSPYLVMQPPEDDSLSFCHVAMHGPYTGPRLVTGPNTVKPRCPACRARFDDWRDRLSAWRAGTERARCSSCNEQWSPSALDWRSHAIGARVLVELRNVYPGEASPSDQLMHGLETATGEDWRYAWAGYLDTTGGAP